ncbi:MAG: leucine-rich repeat domain-containing protein [Oscillospiraceae bacterium]|nr:leucine-rich repeat domain-containing protein [Oscillospiraceae bacterium]
MIEENNSTGVAGYWSEEAKSDKLYVAIRANNTAEIERLRAEGITLSDHIKDVLTIGGGSNANYQKYGMDWYNFNFNLSKYSPREFISVIRNLYAELGKPICYTETVGSKIPEFYSAEVFKCVLDCFDNKKIPKKQTLQQIINNHSVELLEIAAEHGLLRLAKQLDELIEYARQHDKTECAAWLIDYKKRAFDLEKERDKAEKKAERELNAAPDSVTVLKGLWNYKKQDDGTIVITGYKGKRTEITVPEKIGKGTVTMIEDWALSPLAVRTTPERKDVLKAITKITLPNTLKSIESHTFLQMNSLEEINIPDGVSAIKSRAFGQCSSLVKLDIPESVTEIGECVFWYCSCLEEINIPRGVTEIKYGVFLGCGKLKAVDIPDSVQSIGDYAFLECRSLESVNIPKGVQSIGNHAFSGCESLEAVSIPNGVTEISESAFSSCGTLTRVELPDTIGKIGKYAFNGCAALKELVIPEGVREVGDVAFAECTALEKVVLPASLEKAKNLTAKGETPKTIFDNSPNVTAVVTPKSYAEKYCKRNNIPFVYREN